MKQEQRKAGKSQVALIYQAKKVVERIVDGGNGKGCKVMKMEASPDAVEGMPRSNRRIPAVRMLALLEREQNALALGVSIARSRVPSRVPLPVEELMSPNMNTLREMVMRKVDVLAPFTTEFIMADGEIFDFIREIGISRYPSIAEFLDILYSVGTRKENPEHEFQHLRNLLLQELSVPCINSFPYGSFIHHTVYVSHGHYMHLQLPDGGIENMLKLNAIPPLDLNAGLINTATTDADELHFHLEKAEDLNNQTVKKLTE